MPKTIIHVARQAIQKNLKHGTDDPTIIVRNKNKSKRYHKVSINGPSEVVEGILKCGARVWIETESEVIGYER